MKKKGRMQAKRSVSWAGGSYSGEMAGGVPHGRGRLELPDGTRYDGEWLEGVPHGRGVMYYSSGNIYKGEFSNGKRQGRGKYRRADGKEAYGLWESGKLVKAMEEPGGSEEAAFRKTAAPVISIRDLTFRYRSGKGVFNLNFNVGRGEVFGYLGPNGSGKTTTIRCLMGFTKPENGRCTVNGLESWSKAPGIQKDLGYLPGEIAFFDEMSGLEFLNFMGDMRGKRNRARRSALLERFELNPAGKIRRMSKGMKQKLGIVAAFMHDPAVYILDEPTSGLDPLMQNTFVELILEEKSRGKTILMSSHSFEETYRTCDRAGIIREGRLVAVADVHSLKSSQRKAFLVTLQSQDDLEHLRSSGLEMGKITKNTVEVIVSGNYNQFISALAGCRVLGIDVSTQSLEQVFLKYYGREGGS